MQNEETPPNTTKWVTLMLLAVGAITAYRVGLLWFSKMDLFVDEAQYWLWGQDLAFGYYSKPPMIGWLIRGVTELAGSDAPFWVRLPAPILHGVTGLILGAIATRLWDVRAGFVVAVGYLTLPVVAVGSVQISTDTLLFPFLALAMAAYLRVLRTDSAFFAAVTGVALGLGFLAKYAAAYYLVCGFLALLLMPRARPTLERAWTIVFMFLLIISPNLYWNATNGFATVEHTMDNASWVRDTNVLASLNYENLGIFFAEQFAVFGPVLMIALLMLPFRARHWPLGFLLLFSLPIIAIVCVQALLSNAYANWAATAYLAGSLAVLPFLRGRWLIGSFAINGAFCLAAPILAYFADDLKMLERYTGLDEMSAELIETAEQADAFAVVARSRGMLADLHYTGRDSGLAFYAVPPSGRAMNHYERSFPLPADLTGDVLYVSHPDHLKDCAQEVEPLKVLQPETGAYRKQTLGLYLLPAGCAAQR